MLVSKNWLADFVQLQISTETISEKLTSLGLEVESQSKAAPEFSGVVVGRILTLEKHPDADKLRVAQVDIGDENTLQIVCGAANASVDMTVAVATVGAVLPGDFKIKKSKLRGVESFGMLCSEKELGLADDASGIMALTHDLTLGQDIRDALQLDDDIIEIGLTPNRGDCLSILGVARELAVAFDTKLNVKPLPETPVEGESPQVCLTADSACPHYIARTISGINNNLRCPLWLTERLRRAGIRSLTPVVDICNYVMLHLGVPLHSFDAKAIEGRLCVRMAEPNESLTLLDGKVINLDKDLLVIADEKKPLALAGIMGGENSMVSEKTTAVVLESAWFNPKAIAGRARRFNLHTDASHRFERGVDYRLQTQAIEMATQLITAICGGKAHALSIATLEEQLPKRLSIELNAEKIDAVLGVAFPRQHIEKMLTQLGMEVIVDGDNYRVTPPSYRFDITIAEDLIEELSRLWGYENITLKTIDIKKLSHQKKQSHQLPRLMNQLLVDMGYHEAISYSFIDSELAKQLANNQHEIKLANALSAELSVMRTSLVPSLAKILAYNVNRQQPNVRLYEWGNAYQRLDGKIVQTEKLTAIATGDVQPLQWGYRQRTIDFFDIKGDLETLFEHLGVLDDITYQRSQSPFLHIGQAADIFYQGSYLGFVGAFHPNVEKNFDFATKVFAFEIDIAKIMRFKHPVAKSLSKYPEIRRDISLLIAQGYPANEIIDAIKAVDSQLVTHVCLFDVYIGRNLPRNSKSMAIAIYLQDKTKTLTDEQADKVIDKITDTLSQQFNAKLRG